MINTNVQQIGVNFDLPEKLYIFDTDYEVENKSYPLSTDPNDYSWSIRSEGVINEMIDDGPVNEINLTSLINGNGVYNINITGFNITLVGPDDSKYYPDLDLREKLTLTKPTTITSDTEFHISTPTNTITYNARLLTYELFEISGTTIISLDKLTNIQHDDGADFTITKNDGSIYYIETSGNTLNLDNKYDFLSGETLITALDVAGEVDVYYYDYAYSPLGCNDLTPMGPILYYGAFPASAFKPISYENEIFVAGHNLKFLTRTPASYTVIIKRGANSHTFAGTTVADTYVNIDFSILGGTDRAEITKFEVNNITRVLEGTKERATTEIDVNNSNKLYNEDGSYAFSVFWGSTPNTITSYNDYYVRCSINTILYDEPSLIPNCDYQDALGTKYRFKMYRDDTYIGLVHPTNIIRNATTTTFDIPINISSSDEDTTIKLVSYFTTQTLNTLNQNYWLELYVDVM